MTQDCLILNGNGKPLSYFPLSAVDWKTAIKLVFTRNVIIIKEHEDWTVRSPSLEIKIPSIVMLRKYHKFTKKVKFSRSNVFLRDMFTCQYCNDVFEKKDLTIDHIIPKSKGGETVWENVTTSCKTCNLSKADKIIHPAPVVKIPSFRELLKGQEHIERKSIEKDWQEYIVA
tara:strand:- start:948 stop:1463 length:516 start_codon:yes stop_codon:yes gene_type:complete